MLDFYYNEEKFLIHQDNEYKARNYAKKLSCVAERMTALADAQSYSGYCKLANDIDILNKYCSQMSDLMDEFAVEMRAASNMINRIIDESMAELSKKIPNN